MAVNNTSHNVDLFRPVFSDRWPVLGLLVFSSFILKWLQLRYMRRLPPGPPGLPIIGNLHQLSSSPIAFDNLQHLIVSCRPWLTFTKWRETYGPLVYVNFAGQDVLLVGNHKIASDLLDRRASSYSDRPRWIVPNTLTNGLVTAFMPYNATWKRMDRGARETLKHSAATTYRDIQLNEALFLVEDLLNTPNDFDMHFRRAAASTIMRILYGLPPVRNSSDPVIARVNEFTNRALAAALPGRFLVEYFSWMQYLPKWMSPWRRWAEKWNREDTLFIEGMYHDTAKQIQDGDEIPCIVAKLMKESQVGKYTMSEKEAAWLAATFYGAGTDTTSAQMSWIMMALVLHPGVQTWAQTEIDQVAIVKEALRWRGVAPLSSPHAVNRDDWYDGYFIPKGTIVIPNVWYMNHDPEVYGADAEEYRPARYLDPEGNFLPAIPDTKDEGHLTYGFGRRICAGRHVANNNMFIFVASLLWAFEISPGKDASGNIVIPDPNDFLDSSTSLVIRPALFPVTVTPRFPELSSVLDHSKDSDA